VACGIGGDPAQQLKALLASFAHSPSKSAAVGFIHNYELWASASEVLGVARRFDEICRDNRKTVSIKYRNAQGQVALKTLDCTGKHKLGIDMKFLCKLPLPLLGEVRWAEDGNPTYLATVQKLSGNERCLNGLANAHIVGDEHADGVEFERHHQRYELIRAGFHSDSTEAAEWTGRRTRRQTGRIAQEPTRRKVAKVVFAGQGEGCGPDLFYVRKDACDLFVETSNGAQQKYLVSRFGEHNPLATARINEGAWGRERSADHGLGTPKTSACFCRIASQSSLW
jgi:hypothetical protein